MPIRLSPKAGSRDPRHVRHFLLAIGLSRKKQAASPDSWMMQSEMSKKSLYTSSYTLCIQYLRFFYNLEFQRKKGAERFPIV